MSTNSSVDVQRVRADPSRAVVVGARSSLVAEEQVYMLDGWLRNYRQSYSPWTGVKTAVVIALFLTTFVVYIIVRTRCTPDWWHDVCLSVRRAVRSVMRSRADKDDEVGRQPPVTGESATQCLRRVELELVEVINDQNSTCVIDRSANCDNVEEVRA